MFLARITGKIMMSFNEMGNIGRTERVVLRN